MAPRGGSFAVQREATELLWVLTRAGDRPASLVSASHGALTPLTPEFRGAVHAMTLDGRAASLDLMAPVTLDQRHLQPVAGSAGAGER
jgi:hypothetical protein